ncbi:MAG: hypothetical protein Q7I92_11530 [Humidesulfovibrio sp.]|jgi:hypothetical protein|nr:hypothetical protein [Humidesulfovibrio sp.]
MGRKQGQATAFTVVIEPGEVRVRKTLAPAGKPMADKRRKAPRRKPEYRTDPLAEE